jgi:hypothetical protein
MTRFFASVPAFTALCLAGACGDNAPAGDDDDAVDAAVDVDASVVPPGITFYDYGIAVDVTPDGAVAAFEDISTPEARLILVDTATGEARDVGLVGSALRHIATGISQTQRVSALHAEPVQAGLWTEAGGWIDLGSPHAAGCGEDLSSGFDVSADGHVTVGLAWDGCTTTPFRWDDTDGSGAFEALEPLGTPPEGVKRGPNNRATVISDDGAIAAGFGENGVAGLDRVAAWWDADGEGTLIDVGVEAPSEVLSISADGSVMAGVYGYEGWVWTAASGPVAIARPEAALPSDPVFPNAMTADGSAVYGAVGSSFFSIPIAFVWTEQGGTRALADVAADAGIALPTGYTLNNVMGASADGRVLIGIASDADGLSKSFVLRLPAD